jgi:hypothetical protein
VTSLDPDTVAADQCEGEVGGPVTEQIPERPPRLALALLGVSSRCWVRRNQAAGESFPLVGPRVLGFTTSLETSHQQPREARGAAMADPPRTIRSQGVCRLLSSWETASMSTDPAVTNSIS